MTFLIPKVDSNVKAPVEKSCNCCDVITCYLFCCTKRPTSPTPVDKKIKNIAENIISDKKDQIELYKKNMI